MTRVKRLTPLMGSKTRLRGFTGACLITAFLIALVPVSETSAQVVHRPFWLYPLITGQPILPPPHLAPLVPRFYVLLHGYLALDGDEKVPFAAWVMANGIVDPVLVQAMLDLYAWHQRSLT